MMLFWLVYLQAGQRATAILPWGSCFPFVCWGQFGLTMGWLYQFFKQNKSKFVVKLIRVSKTVLSYPQNYSPDMETSVTAPWTSSDEKVSHSLLTSHVFLTLFDTGHMPNGYYTVFLCVCSTLSLILWLINDSKWPDLSNL